MKDIKNSLKSAGLVGTFGQAVGTSTVVEELCNESCLVLTQLGCTQCTYSTSISCSSCAVGKQSGGC